MKRIIVTFLLAMLVLPMLTPATGYALDGVDTEPNNTAAKAVSMSFGGTNFEYRVSCATGAISYNGDEDWFKIWLTPGYHSVTLTNNTKTTSSIYGSLPADYDIEVRGPEPATTVLAASRSRGTTTEQAHFSIAKQGTYFIRIDGYSSAYSSTKYRMQIVKGDAAFYMEGLRYVDYPFAFYGRLFSGTEYHTKGVAYGYGSKDAISDYRVKMTEANANKTVPQDNWNDYSSSYYRPGRYDGETGKWTGIDCSGLIWRAANASTITYAIEGKGIDYVGTDYIYSNSTHISDWRNVEIGDVYVKSGSHVCFASRLSASGENLFKVMHAASRDESRKCQETAITDYLSYSRRALR
ncbi:MAG: hypothetical protein QMD53_03540 [Actinomycetota bacterium]|nr:hypothetical protein [Actinomycetota bacterium]